MENLNQRKASLISELEKLGFTTQHKYLVANGSTNLKKNLKYLKKFAGDQEKALNYFLEKKSFPEGKSTLSTPEDESLDDDYSKEICCGGLLSTWPKTVEYFYLDGNNLLFVDNVIRNMAIKKKRRNEAERVFARLVLKFVEKKSIKNTILIFDNTCYKERLSISNSNDESLMFEVESAYPKFFNSDDALVYYAGENRNLDNSLFVTSDKGLEQRLMKRGARNIMKTKIFFKLLQETLGVEQYNELLKQK